MTQCESNLLHTNSIYFMSPHVPPKGEEGERQRGEKWKSKSKKKKDTALPFYFTIRRAAGVM